MTVDMHGTSCEFAECTIDEIPMKNEDSITQLIKFVDCRSIVTCLKALMLMDRDLLVLAPSNEIAFNVIEGLKQLIFPFTVWNPLLVPVYKTEEYKGGMSLKDYIL